MALSSLSTTRRSGTPMERVIAGVLAATFFWASYSLGAGARSVPESPAGLRSGEEFEQGIEDGTVVAVAGGESKSDGEWALLPLVGSALCGLLGAGCVAIAAGAASTSTGQVQRKDA